MLYLANVVIRSHITIFNGYCLLSLCKTQVKGKKYWLSNNKKTEKNNKLKTVSIKTCMRPYFNCIIQIEDFDFNNNLLVKKSYDCAKL